MLLALNENYAETIDALCFYGLLTAGDCLLEIEDWIRGLYPSFKLEY